MQLQRPAPIHIIWKFPSLSRKKQRVFGIVGQFDTGFDLFLHPRGIASPLPGLSSGSGIEEQDLIKKQKKEAKAKERVEKKKRKEKRALDKALQQQAWAAASTSTSKKMRNARSWDDEDENAEYPETVSGEKKRPASRITKRS